MFIEGMELKKAKEFVETISFDLGSAICDETGYWAWTEMGKSQSTNKCNDLWIWILWKESRRADTRKESPAHFSVVNGPWFWAIKSAGPIRPRKEIGLTLRIIYSFIY